MWRCPNCGEQIGNEFDACWKCGTAQDGGRAADFHAEPSDPAAPDRGPDPQAPTASAEDAEAARIVRERIVELCSAGDIVEAECVCELLEEAGIPARIVNDGLGIAAGGVPFGEPIAPRIWVRESEAAHAREVIEQWQEQQENEPIEFPGSEGSPERGEPIEAEYAALPSDVRFRFLSQGFFIAGLVCILAGAIWAWKNSMTLSMYSGTAVGRAIDVSRYWRHNTSMPGGPGQRLGCVSRVAVQYAYVVDAHLYHAQVDDAEGDIYHVPIHYDPHNPAQHVVGSIAPPWVVLIFAVGIAAFLSFVGYQFR